MPRVVAVRAFWAYSGCTKGVLGCGKELLVVVGLTLGESQGAPREPWVPLPWLSPGSPWPSLGAPGLPGAPSNYLNNRPAEPGKAGGKEPGGARRGKKTVRQEKPGQEKLGSY